MGVTEWDSLISETFFAVNQAKLGILELAATAHPDQLLFIGDASSVRHRLHSGFLALSTGLERLGKVAISSYRWRETGKFPSVRKYNHDIAAIIDDVQQLDLSNFRAKAYAHQPPELEGLQPHIRLLTDYAKGQQRYEYLDSLASNNVLPQLYDRWAGLVRSARVDPHLQLLCNVPKGIADALLDSQVDEVLIWPYAYEMQEGVLEPRTLRVALDFFDIARWVAAVLSLISEQIFYCDPRSSRHPRYPLLAEVIDRQLLHSRLDFVTFSIIGIEDLAVTIEALGFTDEQIEAVLSADY